MARELLRDKARRIVAAALRAADPAEAVRRCLVADSGAIVVGDDVGVRLDLRGTDRIVVVGAGKASGRMACAVEEVLGDRISDGLVVVKDGHAAATRVVRQVEASHPVPDARGVRGAKALRGMLAPLGAGDLVVAVLSGGGSALLTLPAGGLTLRDKQATTRLLLQSGADVAEVNAVRKHLSALKGGLLARTAAPAALVGLVLSDVVGDRLDVIASGPTVPDPTTFADARDVLWRRGIWDEAPPAVQARLRAGCEGRLPDTPKPGDRAFSRCHNVVVASLARALDACVDAARDAGLEPVLLSGVVEGEARDVGRRYAQLATELCREGRPLRPPACLVAGGETTVTMLGGHGTGGRNQELALAAALGIEGLPGVAVVSLGTDGTDGPTDAAGAIAFGDTVQRAREAGFSVEEALASHDAYPLFDAVGDLWRTGPTGTNVMDLHLVIAI